MKKINIDDSLYPEILKGIPNPPLSLYLEGNIGLLNSKSIAIIGSRRASENGKKIAEKFATELSQTGITIVSGLAIGIDTVAHTFSYRQKGKTIAVLGSGFNKIFPEENIELYKKILENDGLIVSEYPPDTEYKSKYFLERNRIVSGLSLGVLVIEAKYRSGTSVTADLAKQQGRNVFAIPHEPWSTNGFGTNRLLKNGATLVTSTEDILKKIKIKELKQYYCELKKSGTFDKISNYSIRKSFKIINLKTIDIPKKSTLTKQKKSLKISTAQKQYFFKKDKISEVNSNSLSKKVHFSDPKQAKIYNIINANTPSAYSSASPNSLTITPASKKFKSSIPVSANNLAHKTGLSINEIQSILFMLEVEGHIKKVSGGYTVCT